MAFSELPCLHSRGSSSLRGPPWLVCTFLSVASAVSGLSGDDCFGQGGNAFVCASVMILSKCKKKVCNLRAQGIGHLGERAIHPVSSSLWSVLSGGFFWICHSLLPALSVLFLAVHISSICFRPRLDSFVFIVYLKEMGSDWSTVVGSPHLWLRKWIPRQHGGRKHSCCNHRRGKKWLPNSVCYC